MSNLFKAAPLPCQRNRFGGSTEASMQWPKEEVAEEITEDIRHLRMLPWYFVAEELTNVNLLMVAPADRRTTLALPIQCLPTTG